MSEGAASGGEQDHDAREPTGGTDRGAGSSVPPDPSDTIRRANPRQQGTIGVGAAIRWFIANGYDVFTPIGEPSHYDLVVVDADGELQRVEVKTTTCRNSRGRFVVQIATSGGNQSWTGMVKAFDPTRVDLLFVLTDDGDEYVIPTDRVIARTKLTLSPAVERFRVVDHGRAQPALAFGTGV